MSWMTGLDFLDADGLRHDMALRLTGDGVAEVVARADQRGTDLSRDGARVLVTPGLIDLQVNGGAGLMLGDCTEPAQLRAITDAHWATGSAAILPTLISDEISVIVRIIDLIARVQPANPALLGLHLEGPHLGVAGAHDPAKLRAMNAADLDLYVQARARLGVLLITLAPECVAPDQIRALCSAGIIVALGHTACDYDTAMAAFEAGAVMSTHLFNAMSGLHHRNPGLVGATLDRGMRFGLIADGVHVHPAALRIAMAVHAPGAVLVSDAMALTGSAQDRFTLAGQTIYRREGRLERADGTLAGADLTLASAVENLARWTGKNIAEIAPMAFAAPARLIGPAHRPNAARHLIWHQGCAIARLEGDRVLPVMPG